MSTARATLAAENRDIIGKKVAQLRRAGRLPAVVYGHGVDSTSISVDAHDFEQLRRHSGPNAGIVCDRVYNLGGLACMDRIM